MSKLDELRRSAGSNIDESMGGGRLIPGVSAGGPKAIPSKLQGVIRSGNAAEIPVEKIGPDDDQPREEFDEAAIDRLAESLKGRGQIQPIRVRWNEQRGLYVIICGERRWRAAMKAGLATLSCVISDAPISVSELLSLQVIENTLREDLSDIELGKAFRSLMDLNGWSTHQVAKELGIVQPRVVRALALLKLPIEVQGQVEQGSLQASVAYQISRMDDAADQIEVAERVVAEGMNRDQASEIVRKVSERKASRPNGGASSRGRGSKSAKSAKLPNERITKTPLGLRVTVTGRKGFGLEDWVRALEHAAQAARARLESDQAAA